MIFNWENHFNAQDLHQVVQRREDYWQIIETTLPLFWKNAFTNAKQVINNKKMLGKSPEKEEKEETNIGF